MIDSAAQTHAIIVAAGRGERSGLDYPKQFEMVEGKALVRHCAESFLSHRAIDRIWIVIGVDQKDMLVQAMNGLAGFKTAIGGTTRQQSVANGLAAIAADGGCKNVLVHDAARPFLTHEVVDRLLDALRTNAAAIPILPTVDTTVSLSGAYIGDAIDRNILWRVQTPQAFHFAKLLSAHSAWPEKKEATDDAQIFKAAGHQVATVEGNEKLAKFTFASDFQARRGEKMTQIRTGLGFDVHQLVTGEELWLGGIKIEHDRGLAGHSDADVLLHALTDALLGAIGAGDIGDHFPPSDPKWRSAASEQFVRHAAALIKAKGGIIHNVDMTLICEAPKIKPHREAMRQNIAKMLDLSADQVSVKATTTEGLGFTGRKEGIAAQAIATVSMEKLWL